MHNKEVIEFRPSQCNVIYEPQIAYDLEICLTRVSGEWDAITNILKPRGEENHPLKTKTESCMFDPYLRKSRYQS